MLASAWNSILDRLGNSFGLCAVLALAAAPGLVDLRPPAWGGHEARAWILAAAAVATGCVWMAAVYLGVELAGRALAPRWRDVAVASGAFAAGMMAMSAFVAVGASLRLGLEAFAPNLLAFAFCAAAPPLLLCRLALSRVSSSGVRR